MTVWPCVPFRQAQWRRYYVYAHRAECLDVWGLADGVWRQGRVQQAQRQSWQVLPCERYPDYVLLRKGALDCGALPNPLPPQRRSQAESAVMALDFGSTGTAVCFRQGEKIQPAQTACLQRTLLHGPFAVPLCDEFLPNAPMGNIRFSAMDMFGDDPAAWREPLLDGHAFTPTSLEAICRKETGRLYYGLKWGREDFRRRLNELFLHQAMTESVLAAHLSGAPDVSWRVAMPAALPLDMRQSYLAQVQLLARQVEPGNWRTPHRRHAPRELGGRKRRGGRVFPRPQRSERPRGIPDPGRGRRQRGAGLLAPGGRRVPVLLPAPGGAEHAL